MKALLLGSLVTGSQLYSQCLRDILRVKARADRTKEALQFIVDDSSAGQLAKKLIEGAQGSVVQYRREIAIPQATLILVYMEDPETDAHFEEQVYAAQTDDCEIFVRAQPKKVERHDITQPPDDPYADFKRAFSLVERRIRPIPTRGPQIWREIEIRPNGGAPWFRV